MDDFNTEDLKLKMSLACDDSGVTSTLTSMGASVDDITNGFAVKMSDALKQQQGQLTHINQLMGPQAGMIRDQVVAEQALADARSKLEEMRAAHQLDSRGFAQPNKVTATETVKHVESLTKIQEDTDPAKIRERLAMEQQITEARRKYKELEDSIVRESQPKGVNLAALQQRVNLLHEEAKAQAELQHATVTVETDSSKIRERLLYEQQITEAKRKYKELEDSIRRESQPQGVDTAALQQRVNLLHEEAKDQAELQYAIVTVETDPTKIRERLLYEQKIVSAREKYKELEDSIARELGLQSPLPKELSDLEKMSAELDDQEETIAKIAMLMDPSILGRRVELSRQEAKARAEVADAETRMSAGMSQTERVANSVLEVSRQLTRDILQQREIRATMAAMDDPSLAAAKEKLLAEQTITTELQHQAALEAIKQQSSPQALEDSVRRQKELTEAKKQFESLKAGEEKRQRTPEEKDSDAKKKKDAADNQTASNLRNNFRQFQSQGAAGGVLAMARGKDEKGNSKDAGGELANIGGMIGEAVGGPAGAVIGEMVGKAVQGTIEAPAKMVVGGLKMVDGALKDLQGPLGPIGMALNLLGDAAHGVVDVVSKVSPVLGAVIGPLAELPGIFASMLTTLTSMSGLASPATLQQFNIALQDVQGVIGGTFLPMLEMMREGVRLFGDVLANILPNFEESESALSGLRASFNDFQTAVRDALREVGPEVREMLIGLLRQMGNALGAILSSGKELIEPLKELWRAFRDIKNALDSMGGPSVVEMLMTPITLAMRSLAAVARVAALGINLLLWPLRELGLIGAAPSQGDNDRSSVGAATRHASFQSAEQYQQHLQLAAYNQPGQMTMQNVPTLVGDISTTLTSIRDLVQGIRNFLEHPIATSTAAAVDGIGGGAGAAAMWAANVWQGGNQQ